MSLRRILPKQENQSKSKSKSKSRDSNKDRNEKEKGKRNRGNDLDLYGQLKRDIQVIRKQGEPPEKDPFTFSRYVCDLCSTSHPISELKQCAVCGRWACRECWTQEYYLCNSCNGILALKNINL